MSAETVPDALAAFLTAAAHEPFIYGRADCGLWLADWARFSGAAVIDPARDLRGRYGCPRSAAQLIRNAGGFVALVDRLAERAGFVRLVRPLAARAGDIAVASVVLGEPLAQESVGAPDRARRARMGVVMTGALVGAARAGRGLVVGSVAPLAAWAHPATAKDGR